MLAPFCSSFWKNTSNDCSKHGGGALQEEAPGVGQAIRKQVYLVLSRQGLLLFLRGVLVLCLSAQEHGRHCLAPILGVCVCQRRTINVKRGFLMYDLAKSLNNLQARRREDRGHICPPQATLSGPGPVSAHDRHSVSAEKNKHSHFSDEDTLPSKIKRLARGHRANEET